MNNRVALDGLAELFEQELVSVEILPGGLGDWQSIEIPPESPMPSSNFPYILVNGNLGIPKKVAQELYLYAISLPWRSLREPHDAVVQTTVILIVNPAHQTALNARKRLIISGHIQPQRELRYAELLLRGSNDWAKQSIVWDHRRWCLTYLYGINGSPYPIALEHLAFVDGAQAFPNTDPDVILKEIGIVYHACETYPRNYHAWTYFHWLISGTFASVHNHVSDEAARQGYRRILVDTYLELRTWVDRHPSDYSAIHQLCQMEIIKDRLLSVGVLTKEVEEGPSTMAGHCLSLLHSFPSHESLWMYLRLALKDEPRSNILDRIKSDFNSNLHAVKLLAWFRRGSGSD